MLKSGFYSPTGCFSEGHMAFGGLLRRIPGLQAPLLEDAVGQSSSAPAAPLSTQPQPASTHHLPHSLAQAATKPSPETTAPPASLGCRGSGGAPLRPRRYKLRKGQVSFIC